MPTSGRDHEDLVTRLEELLAPPGFTVRSQVHEWDETGELVAEFDVLVEGQIGDISTRILLECRDRPSAGPAPKSWIEQLMGRRIVHGFGKVWAVSTTGFTSPAVKTAQRHDIGLKTVERFSNVTEELGVRKLNLKVYQVEVEDDTLTMTTDEGSSRIPDDSQILDPELMTPQSVQTFLCLREMRHDATLPSDPKTYFEGFNSLPQDERFEKIEEFFLRVQSRAGALGVQVRDVTIDEPLIIAEGQEWKARSLTCRATTRVTNKNGAVAVVYLYKEKGQELLAGETAFQFELEERTWAVRVQETASGEVTLVMPDDWQFAARISTYSRINP